MKLLSFVLVALFLLATLLACRNTSNNPASSDPQTSTPTEGTAPIGSETDRSQYPDDIPDELDYDGAQISVAVMKNDVYIIDWVYDKDLTGETVNTLIYERNMKIEDELGVTLNITSDFVQSSYVVNFAMEILAETGAYDIINVGAADGTGFLTSQCLLDLNTVNYINFEQPWWNQSILETCSINGKSYFATGDIGFRYINGAGAFVFNKELAEQVGIEDMYQLVKDVEWTYDMLYRYSTNFYSDLNGNTEIDDEDRFGFVADAVVSLDPFYAAFDQPITEIDDGFPTLVCNTEKMANVVDMLHKLYNRSAGSFIVSADNSMDKVFLKGNTLFTPIQIAALGSATFRESEIDIGVAPYPKYDENQATYLTHNRNGYSQYGIALTCDTVDMAGAVLELAAAENYRKVIPTYYEEVLQIKYSRDDANAEMIDIIFENVRCDFAFYTDILYILRNTVGKKNSGFASYYGKYESGYQRILNNTINAFTDGE